MVQDNSGTKEEIKAHFWEQFSRKLIHISKEFNPIKVSLRIAGIYVFSGVLWILLSDKVLEGMVQDKYILTVISMVKGWIFVFVTGVVIFGLVYFALRRIHEDELRIVQSYKEITATYEELEAAHEELTATEEELRLQFETLLESQKQLSKSEERYRLISEATKDGIWDEHENKRYFSDRWFEITGYTREDLERIGDWKSLIYPDDYEAANAIMVEHQQMKTQHYCCEYRLKGKDGQYIWIQARGKALFDETGNVCNMAGSHSDITKLKKYQQELHYIAYHDLLTDLPNRAALYVETEKLIRANPDSNFTLLFIDADNFKFINDTMGHDSGDQLIKLMGKRLGYLVKETCSIYRLGGDEFIIVHKNSKKKEDVEVFASHVLSGFKEPFKVGDSVLHINISIGVSVYPENGRDINELLRCADIAMYRAKEAGRNRHMVYEQPMNEIITERALIEKYLHTALENDEFKLVYQPQFGIKENMVTGFEALLRWNSQELGLVSPLKFIKVAEETHLIISLGKWVLWKACAFIKKLHTQGHTDLSISVNISILQLLQNDFVDSVLDVLEVYDLNPECLELEITESILMESYETIEGSLKLLCDKGVKISLDDFGKGYSSLSYLKELPITTLKIDKSFVDSISSESGNKSLTGQIVEMGRSMDLSVVAEGVETQEQLKYLICHECDKIQGYLFSKPLPEIEAEELVVNGTEAKY